MTSARCRWTATRRRRYVLEGTNRYSNMQDSSDLAAFATVATGVTLSSALVCPADIALAPGGLSARRRGGQGDGARMLARSARCTARSRLLQGLNAGSAHALHARLPVLRLPRRPRGSPACRRTRATPRPRRSRARSARSIFVVPLMQGRAPADRANAFNNSISAVRHSCKTGGVGALYRAGRRPSPRKPSGPAVASARSASSEERRASARRTRGRRRRDAESDPRRAGARTHSARAAFARARTRRLRFRALAPTAHPPVHIGLRGRHRRRDAQHSRGQRAPSFSGIALWTKSRYGARTAPHARRAVSTSPDCRLRQAASQAASKQHLKTLTVFGASQQIWRARGIAGFYAGYPVKARGDWRFSVGSLSN